MDTEKDPILPDMKPSKEDIAQRQKQLAARRAAAQRAAAAKNRQAPAAATAPAPKQTLAIVALLVAIAMGGLAGFLFMQMQTMQQQLTAAEKVMRSQAENLAVLNEKLSVTGENANLSVDALKALVKENASEIRKLWDVSNKRNKANIASNSKNITALKGGIAALKKDLAGLESKQASALSGLEKKLTSKDAALTSRIAKVEKEALDVPAENQLRIAQITENLQMLDAKVSKVRDGGDMGDMKLEIEDIQIRLDRIQNALGGGVQ
ncbi:MAG: hypothetical protein CMI02_00580 [Oceanospirillaceae bacterium]|nr:hypothetical protein [Oceanospirillaceae bacterium]MBT10514.1 hypothetical protein [Oceanospirillaceae bacterium]|tara:strand:- start:93292 stop:94086 length:795 start_codon:yes stop_codon:yes gene_type:complete